MGSLKLEILKNHKPALGEISKNPPAKIVRIDHFLRTKKELENYYLFGMAMGGRKGSTESYRYGFQGQEKDDEIKGEGNSINYKFRMHDPRLGRFFAVDPLTAEYPFYSPYAFSGNRVIDSRELEGAEPESMITAQGKLTRPMIAILNIAYNYKYKRMNKTTWKEFKNSNSRANAMTVYNNVFYNTHLNSKNRLKPLSWKGSYENFWFHLIVHEHKHKDEITNNTIIGTLWYLNYFTFDIGVGFVVALFNGDIKKEGLGYGTYINMPSEKRAYALGANESSTNSDSENLFNYNNGELLDVLNNVNLSEKDKTLRAIEVTYNYSKDKILSKYSGNKASRKINKLNKRKKKSVERIISNDSRPSF